ncbi:MAG: BrnA antitoxin family protein [Thermodesulfobacteriota bacterium]
MKKASRTNWTKIKSMKDREIDFSDIPKLADDFFKEAVLWPGKKKQITIRLDPDILDFYKGAGRGYQSRINNVLRRYMEAFDLKEKQARYIIKKSSRK